MICFFTEKRILQKKKRASNPPLPYVLRICRRTCFYLAVSHSSSQTLQVL